MDPVVVKGQPVSSSRIRRLLDEGDVGLAGELLGRPHSIGGRVIPGDGRGSRKLGIPTANIYNHSEVIPGNGVYCCWLQRAAQHHRAVVNIGTKPTFAKSERTIEAHVLDFDGDLYGQSVELFFVARLRDERRFDSPASLVEQIRRDIQQARGILTTFPQVVAALLDVPP